MSRCLICYQVIDAKGSEYHMECLQHLFGQSTTPELPYEESELERLAEQVVKRHVTIPGVQPKLSLDFDKHPGEGTSRLTIVGLWGRFILKPPAPDYPHLPEIEDVTMHLASIAGLDVVPHGLIRMKGGTLAYITKRIDRIQHQKIHMEDMCQLTNRMTEQKYQGSYEQIANVILEHSSFPIYDVLIFFNQVIFSFLTGNADMHLKNFSLIHLQNGDIRLTPAYDLVATDLLVEGDDEDLALNINGRKKKLTQHDFEIAMRTSKIADKAIKNLFERLDGTVNNMLDFLDQSFIPEKQVIQYKQLIKERCKRLGLEI